MAKAQFDLKQFDIKSLDLTVATKPLYAGAGVADLAVEAVRDYAAEIQKKVAELRGELKGLDLSTVTKDAKARRAALEARVAELQSEAKTLPTKAQKYFDENLTTVSGTYGELVVRGEGLVKRIRNQESTKATVKSAKTTTAKAKTTKTQATKAAKSTASSAKKSAAKKSAPAKRSAKATGTAAKKTATSAAKATADAAAKVGD